MQVRATLKAVRLSPRKARLTAANVIGMDASRALDILRFMPQKAAGILRKVMYSALSNSADTSLDPDTLVVRRIIINEGPSWKRFMPRAQGRATSIKKRTSHITVILAEY
jgi:large subunit ribosomal protein L22